MAGLQTGLRSLEAAIAERLNNYQAFSSSVAAPRAPAWAISGQNGNAYINHASLPPLASTQGYPAGPPVPESTPSQALPMSHPTVSIVADHRSLPLPANSIILVKQPDTNLQEMHPIQGFVVPQGAQLSDTFSISHEPMPQFQMQDGRDANAEQGGPRSPAGPVIQSATKSYRTSQYNFSHLNSASDRTKRLRTQVLNKLAGEIFEEKLNKVLVEKHLSRSDLDKMSLTELRNLWRIVHRRWHSSYRCQRSKVANADKRKASAQQAAVDNGEPCFRDLGI